MICGCWPGIWVGFRDATGKAVPLGAGDHISGITFDQALDRDMGSRSNAPEVLHVYLNARHVNLAECRRQNGRARLDSLVPAISVIKRSCL